MRAFMYVESVYGLKDNPFKKQIFHVFVFKTFNAIISHTAANTSNYIYLQPDSLHFFSVQII